MSLRLLPKLPVLIGTLLLLFVGAFSARAQNTAWAQARNYLPADTQSVVGLDLAALNRTRLWTLLTTRIATAPAKGKNADVSGLKQLFAKGPANTPALIDYVTDLVVANDTQDAVLYVAFHHTTADAFARALVTAKTGTPPARAALTFGKLTGYKTRDGKIYYFCFLSDNVLVCLPSLADRSLLQKWTVASRLPAKLATLVAQTNRSTAVWLASIEPQPLDETLSTIGQYGTLNVVSGRISIELHLLAANVQAAADASASVNRTLTNFRTVAQIQPQFAALLKMLSVTTTGSQVVLRDEVDEANVEPLLSLIASALSS